MTKDISGLELKQIQEKKIFKNVIGLKLIIRWTKQGKRGRKSFNQRIHQSTSGKWLTLKKNNTY